MEENFLKDIENEVDKVFNEYISSFLNEVSKKYNLERSKLEKLICTPSSFVNIEKASKKELTSMCLERNLKVTGTKEELIARLLNKDEAPKPAKKPKKLTKYQLLEERKKKIESIVQKINKCEPLKVSRNKYGNYEHKETGFIFKNNSNNSGPGIVIGKQNGEVIEELNEKDIELCNKYKLVYKLPENLDKNKKHLEDIKLDKEEEELLEDEDEIEEEDEEEFEEEIEEDDLEEIEEDFEEEEIEEEFEEDL